MTDTATLGTIEHIDPSTLVIEDNVRSSAPLTKEFVASIRENGVLQPVLARRDANGAVIVRAGQRRTSARVRPDDPRSPSTWSTPPSRPLSGSSSRWSRTTTARR